MTPEPVKKGMNCAPFDTEDDFQIEKIALLDKGRKCAFEDLFR